MFTDSEPLLLAKVKPEQPALTLAWLYAAQLSAGDNVGRIFVEHL